MIRKLLQKLRILPTYKWYEPEDPTPTEQCPCCDYFTLAERNRYLICDVCYWEDEGQDLDDPGEYSGPNHMTLREGRENFARFGACSEDMLKHVLPVAQRLRYKFERRTLS